METESLTINLEDSEFKRISQMVYSLAGIQLSAGKECLVKSRLARRLRSLGLNRYSDYINYVENDKTGQERIVLLDSLTTNKTSFFREQPHFDFLKTHVLPQWTYHHTPRIWSAACSSGEEPYSIAMWILDHVQSPANIRILATDISSRMLAKAQKGTYEETEISELPRSFMDKYLKASDERSYHVNSQVRSLIRFARLNLMGAWPMKGPFDVIFCRNVMIYFDKPTQETLVNRFHGLLAKGGHLFVGHSESLTGQKHPFTYVQPAVYRKK